MAEDPPTSAAAHLNALEVARHGFTTVRRGFDPQEVRAYLEVLGRELQAVDQREEELRRALADAEERASHPVLDEATLSSAVGHQSGQILRHAHEEAARITRAAEEQAATTLRAATQQAGEVSVQAESTAAARVAEAELAAGSVRERLAGELEVERAAARSESVALVAEARTEAIGVVAEARAEAQAVIDQAQDARKRVLADLAQRRRTLHIQIEQLRAARDELARAVLSVRGSLDEIVGGLSRADDDARSAAAAVARQFEEEGEGTVGVKADREEPAAGPAGLEEPTVALPAVGGPPADEGFRRSVAATDEVPAVEAEDAPSESPTGAVDALFARIRAGTGSSEEPSAEPGEEPGDDRSVDETDLALGHTRDAELSPIVARLSRRVKRALQDDQNRLLDRLRSGSGGWSEDLLVDEAEQRVALEAVARDSLAEALDAGADFGAAHGGQGATPDPALASEAAEGLASAVVTLLRRRFTGEGGVPAGSAPDEAADRIGAAYREWRGERTERLVADHALGAWAAGVVATAGDGLGLRWVIGEGGPACADCDDNALGGVVGAGSEFPTGHRHPPAHAGCRCLVVPTPV